MKRLTVIITLLAAVVMSSGCEVDFFTTLQNDIRTYSDGNGGGEEHSQAYLDLQAVIQSSQAKHNGATEGTSVGNYRSGSKATLQGEIDSATTVLNDPGSTDPNYDNARTTLAAANTTFDTRLVTNLDIFIFIDTTGSMTGLDGIKDELIFIINNISVRNSDARYAVIAFGGSGIEPTGGFDDSNAATNAIFGLSPGGGGAIDVPWAIQTATGGYSWTAGSDRFAIFITDSNYSNLVNPPDYEDVQNMLTSNNIISVACVDSDSSNQQAQILFDGPPLNAYNGISGLWPHEDIGNTIRSVLQSNIAYW